jgi:hypothetical protein
MMTKLEAGCLVLRKRMLSCYDNTYKEKNETARIIEGPYAFRFRAHLYLMPYIDKIYGIHINRTNRIYKQYCPATIYAKRIRQEF